VAPANLRPVKQMRAFPRVNQKMAIPAL